MTLNQYLRDAAQFRAEIADDESEKRALIARKKAAAARSFAERARLARIERDAA